MIQTQATSRTTNTHTNYTRAKTDLLLVYCRLYSNHPKSKHVQNLSDRPFSYSSQDNPRRPWRYAQLFQPVGSCKTATPPPPPSGLSRHRACAGAVPGGRNPGPRAKRVPNAPPPPPPLTHSPAQHDTASPTRHNTNTYMFSPSKRASPPSACCCCP